jgi:hypothetical protein
MKGHEFVIACQRNFSRPRAVFVEFSGQPDPSLPIPVVVADPKDHDYRWAKDLVVHVVGIDSEAVFEAVEALKLFKARRIFAHYRETLPGLVWDSERDA